MLFNIYKEETSIRNWHKIVSLFGAGYAAPNKSQFYTDTSVSITWFRKIVNFILTLQSQLHGISL